MNGMVYMYKSKKNICCDVKYETGVSWSHTKLTPISLYICQDVYLSDFLSICLLICRFVCLTFCFFNMLVCLSICVYMKFFWITVFLLISRAHRFYLILLFCFNLNIVHLYDTVIQFNTCFSWIIHIIYNFHYSTINVILY